MKGIRLKRAENISSDDFPTSTPEQQKEDTQALLNELADIAEKLPPDSSPAQTLKQVLADFHKPRTTIVERQDGTKLIVRNGVVTVISPTEVTEISSPVVTDADSEATTFTDSELEILEKLRNG